MRLASFLNKADMLARKLSRAYNRDDIMELLIGLISGAAGGNVAGGLLARRALSAGWILARFWVRSQAAALAAVQYWRWLVSYATQWPSKTGPI